jgi:hypothetical protein
MRSAGSPGCLGRPGVLVEVGGPVLDQSVEDLVAVGEEAVQGGDGHPGTFGDGPGRGRVHALSADAAWPSTARRYRRRTRRFDIENYHLTPRAIRPRPDLKESLRRLTTLAEAAS